MLQGLVEGLGRSARRMVATRIAQLILCEMCGGSSVADSREQVHEIARGVPILLVLERHI